MQQLYPCLVFAKRWENLVPAYVFILALCIRSYIFTMVTPAYVDLVPAIYAATYSCQAEYCTSTDPYQQDFKDRDCSYACNSHSIVCFISRMARDMARTNQNISRTSTFIFPANRPAHS